LKIPDKLRKKADKYPKTPITTANQRNSVVYRLVCVEYQPSCVEYRPNSVEYQLSYVEYRPNSVEYQLSYVEYQSHMSLIGQTLPVNASKYQANSIDRLVLELAGGSVEKQPAVVG
jgi:hypothetical protein